MVIVDLLGIVVVGLVIWGLWWIASSAMSGSRGYKKQAMVERRNAISAEQALRRIASNASGNPVLDAQIALDEIDMRRAKELGE